MTIVLIGCVNGTVTRGGVQKSEHFADVIYVWPLKGPFIYDVYTERGGQLAQIEDVVREVACI